MTERRRALLLAVLGAALLAITVVQAMLHQRPAPIVDGYARLVEFVVGWVAAGVLYAWAAWLALQARGRLTLGIVLAGAILLRAIPLETTPFLSTDVYRYVWDGRVQAAGINPYCCVPTDPALASLRDAVIYPHINRPDYAPTIYPPVAQVVFALVGATFPTVLAMKTAMVAAEAVAVAAMLALLARAGLASGRVLIYAWHPLAVWEYAGNGHVDALAFAAIGLALLAASARRQSLAGLAFAAAVLTKFLPAVLGPALWEWRGRGFWRMPLAAMAVTAFAYGAYASVGWRVFGFLGGYASEEGIGSGDGIVWLQFLARLIALPPWAGAAWLAFATCVLAAIAVRALRTPRTPARIAGDALLLATTLTVAITPHYAWYFGWLAYLSCLTPRRSVIFLTVACMISYLDRFHTNLVIAGAIYAPFVTLAALDIWRPANHERSA